MPAKYEKMRDAMAKKMPMKKAKRIAAATYNKHRKPGQKPVTRNYDELGLTSKSTKKSGRKH